MKFFSSCVDVWLERWNWRIYPACWCFAGRRWYSQAEVIHATAVLPDVRWDACLWKRDKVGELITIIIIIITMTMFMVLSSWPKVSARVHPVHLMNADWAPGRRQPSDQASRLGLWVYQKSAATIHIHCRHSYYYSVRKMILILPSHGGWKAESICVELYACYW